MSWIIPAVGVGLSLYDRFAGAMMMIIIQPAQQPPKPVHLNPLLKQQQKGICIINSMVIGGRGQGINPQ